MSDLEQQLVAVSQASLRDLVARLGVSYEHTIEAMCDSINRQYEDPRRPGTYLYSDRFNLPLRSETDYWRFRDSDARDMLSESARLIDNAIRLETVKASSLQLDELKDELDAVLGEPVEASSAGDLALLIPIVHLSEPSFGAFASSGDDLLDFPHVRHYYMTERALQLATYALVYGTTRLEDQTQAVQLLLFSSIGVFDAESDLQRTIGHILDALESRLGAFDYAQMPAYPYNKQSMGEAQRALAAVFSVGARQMIWLHELGHHLLGHLRSEKSPRQKEIEADVFALGALVAEQPMPAAMQYLAGAQVPFEIMRILMPDAGDYPDPAERANNVFSLRTKERETVMLYEYMLVPLHIAVLRRKNIPMDEIEKYIDQHVFEHLRLQGLL